MKPNNAMIKQHVKLLNLLTGVLELKDINDIRVMEEMVDIHGQELFEWIDEYMIDHKDIGCYKLSLESFVNGIRYLIFSKLEGGVLGYGRATKPLVSKAMLWRLKSVEVMHGRGTWGITIPQGDASGEEAGIFAKMIRHGITEGRIRALQTIDRIMEE